MTDLESPYPPPRNSIEDSSRYSSWGWHFSYNTSHILPSVCTDNCSRNAMSTCDVCRYERILRLPHLPDMVFAQNNLILVHKNGARLEFNPLDALQTVCTKRQPIQVASADEWQESRPEHLRQEKLKPFDWTFTSTYQGTINDKFEIVETNETINMFKLMRKEPIHFYTDVTLFEDELHDNGISQCTVKIRVMDSGFYILLRHFLRIDNVLIRMNDSRYHLECDKNFILRENTTKEANIEYLKQKHVPPALFTVPQEIEKFLPVVKKSSEKLIFAE